MLEIRLVFDSDTPSLVALNFGQEIEYLMADRRPADRFVHLERLNNRIHCLFPFDTHQTGRVR